MLSNFKWVAEIYPSLSQLKDDFYIIGSSALILLEVDLKTTSDIDIITSKKDAIYLQSIWQKYIVPQKKLDNSNIIKDFDSSVFNIFRFSLMNVEIMADLVFCRNEQKYPVKISEFVEIHNNNYQIKVPSLEGQKRLLKFHARKKDLERLELIENKNL